MTFQKTKSEALSVINTLREIANTSTRNVLQNKNGKFQKDLVMLENQINTMRFTVGVVGIFNTGKSTFLNALLHQELLSTKILPETAAITTLNYAEEDKATIHYWTTEEWDAIKAQGASEDKDSKLSKISKMVKEIKQSLGTEFDKYISRSGEKTENIPLTELGKYTSANVKDGLAKLVREVEVETQFEFCKNNIQIVDTPGLNDPVKFREHITVDRFLPRCDMLLFLLPARQPFTDSDKEFLEKQLKQKQLHKLFVLVNQVDTLRSDESVDEIIEFARTQLEETFDESDNDDAIHLTKQIEIFPIAAYQSFLNRTGQPAQWTDEKSGVPAFEDRLRRFLFEGERAQAEQDIWKSRLKSCVTGQFAQIDNQLVNLDKPVKELEETIKEVKREHDVITSRLERTMAEVERTLGHFERQYQAQVERMAERVIALAFPIEKKMIDKVKAYLTGNAWSVTKNMKKWVDEQFKPFLEKTIQNEVETVVLDAGEQIQQLAETTLKDVERSWERMVSDISVQIPVKNNVGADYASIIGSTALGAGAGVALASILALATAHFSSYLAAAFLGPAGWALMGIGAVWMAVSGGRSVKDKILSKFREELPPKLHEVLKETAKDLKNRMLKEKSALVKELLKVAETPAIEIQGELQQQQTNLDQLLADKKSQQFDIDQKRSALNGEKNRFEAIFGQIETM